MPSFTREQLRSFTTNSANFTAQAYDFELVNNATTVQLVRLPNEAELKTSLYLCPTNTPDSLT